MILLLMMWVVIDMTFFLILILPLRKQVTKYKNKMWQRSIKRIKSLGERLYDILVQVWLFFFMGMFVYIFVYMIPDIGIQKFLEWYKGIFIVALFPLLFSWIRMNNIKTKSIWNGSLAVFAVLFSIVGYIIDTEKIESILQYRKWLNILITILITLFLVSLFKMQKVSNEYYSKKLPKKGIRKDLYCRTPGLTVNVSNIELIRYCEKYFDEYMHKYRKIKELCTIEYVNLAGAHIELWYAKAARFMKIFVAVSIFIVVIDIKFVISYECFLVIELIIVFAVLISAYKYIDLECLYKIGIRYVYDEWGYYLTCTNKNKFVGTVQIIELSKFHKYAHSFLDIVALCRTVAFSDKMSGESKICIVTKNLGELFTNYTDDVKNKNWVMIIPLWIAALFEFYVTGEVGAEIKTILLKFVDESVRADISIFLQSFWADMERKELKDGILDYMKTFEAELYF